MSLGVECQQRAVPHPRGGGYRGLRKKCFVNRSSAEGGRRRCRGAARGLRERRERQAGTGLGRVPPRWHLPRAASSRDCGGRGFSVCLHPPVSGSPSDSRPHCVSPKSFSDSGPEGCSRGPGCSRWDKTVKFEEKKKMKPGLDLSLPGCTCVLLWSLGRLY